eukprot:TRINITY_DN2091_c0_g1_i2.p1 TRINITY_DN2091_c0_g1~~TRINITY_DN2091_c0_g1_i2.p1  ORF type:complete len:154 (-),score=35.14 TRINITY_DN2091_c0_g1_i2:142-603(-)
MYKEAIDIYDIEQKIIYAGETYAAATRFAVGSKRYMDAIEIYQEIRKAYEQNNKKGRLHKLYTSVIILYLAMKDEVAADRCLVEFSQSCHDYLLSEEYEIANLLQQSYSNMDQELLEKAKKHHLVEFLENEVAEVLNNLDCYIDGEISSEELL